MFEFVHVYMRVRARARVYVYARALIIYKHAITEQHEERIRTLNHRAAHSF